MNSLLNIPLNSWYNCFQETPRIERDFFKSSQIRDFLEIIMKLQVSMDSELGGRELGGLFNLYLIRHVYHHLEMAFM